MSEVHLHVEAGIATVTMNRPDRLNAMNPKLYRVVAEAANGWDGGDPWRPMPPLN
jgi:enoyl-CoA hydratase/carnithine racemase